MKQISIWGLSTLSFFLITIIFNFGLATNSLAKKKPICVPCAEVIRILDGDTVKARIRILPNQTATRKIRLLNIDAPETGRVSDRGNNPKCLAEQQLGKQAKAHLEKLLTVKTKKGEKQKRKYKLIELDNIQPKYDSGGRLVADIYILSGKTHRRTRLKSNLLRNGFAQEWDYYNGAPKPDWCSGVSAGDGAPETPPKTHK